jgi:hypothetical protein
MHRRGVATLLVEHLVSLARAHGVTAFTAEVLGDNYAVQHVLTDSGLAMRRRSADGVVELSMPLPRVAALGEASAYLDAVSGRDRHANVASLEPLLNPRSVAVVGAGRRPGSIGRTILLNIRDAGFAGTLYAVSSGGGDVEGVPCIPSVAGLPRPQPGGADRARKCRRSGPGVRERGVAAGGDYRWPDDGAGIGLMGRPAGQACGWRAGLLRHAVPGIGLAAHRPCAILPRAHRPDVQSAGSVRAAQQFSRMGIESRLAGLATS